MPSGETVIFLDIDGVLVNRRSLKERSGLRAVADPRCVTALNWIIRQTDAVIVVTSSWRFCGLEEMRAIFRHWEVAGTRLVSMTPDLTRTRPEGIYEAVPRSREIQEWMNQNGTPERFVILDDDSDMEHLLGWLVRTDFEAGLTMEDANRAIAILSSANAGTSQPITSTEGSVK